MQEEEDHSCEGDESTGEASSSGAESRDFDEAAIDGARERLEDALRSAGLTEEEIKSVVEAQFPDDDGDDGSIGSSSEHDASEEHTSESDHPQSEEGASCSKDSHSASQASIDAPSQPSATPPSDRP